MDTKQSLITSFALTLALAGASAQQWTSNLLPPGVISWWQADGNLLDSVGTNHLQADGSVTFASGRFGQAFRFDGVSTSAYQPGAAPALNDWSQFSLEAWVNLDATNDIPSGPWGRAIFSRVGNPSDYSNYNQGYQFGIYSGSTRVFFQFNVSGQGWPGYQITAALPAPLVTGTWYHLAATYDHNAMKVYFNGMPLATNVIGPVTLVHSSSLFRISKDDNLNVPFAGRIDDARIYNRALTEAEVAYLFAGPTPPVTQGLKLHFDANDVNAGSNPAEGGPVTTWRDLSGNGLDASSAGFAAPVYRVSAINGRGGIDFGGSGSDALATVFSDQLNLTSATVFMVANHASQPAHVSISAAAINQEFLV